MTRRIVVLGAGIAGLATAWFLKRSLGSEVELTLVEKSPRAGGWIQTIRRENFLFEQGPRSCRTQGAGRETLALVEALGLQDQVLLPHRDARDRYLYEGDRLLRLPRHLWEVPFNRLTRGWLRALWRDGRMPRAQEGDESIQEFFCRRLGSAWLERLVDPVVSGIYAGDCRRLSLKSCFPLLGQWEQQHGSLLRGAWRHRQASSFDSPFIRSICRSPLFSFRHGMEMLPQALAEQLGDHLLLNASVTGLTMGSEGIEVQLSSLILKADHVISTLPSFSLAPLLSSYPHLAARVNALPYATVWVVNIGFEKAVLPLKGFGYLVPSRSSSRILGCVWDSSIFPEQNAYPGQTRLTVMLGGRHHPEVAQMGEKEVIAHALQAIEKQMGIRAAPSIVQATKAQEAIPQYEVGYEAWKQELLQTFHLLSPRLILSGSAWTGVSLNEGIAHARQLVTHWGVTNARSSRLSS